MSTSISSFVGKPDIRVLVIKLRHHGDMLLMSPVLETLRAKWPKATIDVLLYEETRDMLSALPSINHIYGIDRKWKKLGTHQHLTKEWQLLKQLRNQHYDLVLNLADQWRSALVTRFTGAPVRIGFGFNKRKGHIWSCCHTQLASVSGHQNMHTVEQNLSIFAPFAIPTVSDVKMAWPPTAWQTVENKLKALNVSAPYIIIQPTSRWFFKCWSEEKMAQTICELQKQGFPIILTSGPDAKERAMIAEIQANCPVEGVYSLAGELTLQQLAALIDHAKLFIGVDSVPMHMAAALHTPCIALFGPSKLQFWRPWQATGEVIWAGDYGPLPDPDAIDTHTSERYLDAIPAEAVINAARKYL